MKKIDIQQAEPIRKKFTPDWEIRKGTYLYKKVAFDDYNQTLRFLMAIEKPQIELDHFADFMNFYNELTIAITTHDVKGLTQLDFELALHIDKALEQMGARQLDEKWSAKYKKSINCSNPKGFSQKAHCAGRKKKESIEEGYKLQLERDKEILVLHIKDTKTGKRTEVRGKKGYESGNYDANDKLHQLLDKLGKSVDISQLMNGEPVGIRPQHPDGTKAKAATDVAYNENFADGKKKGKSRLKEQPWNNQSDTGSLSSKIFQPGDFISNQGDPIWGLWLPLSSGILHRLTPKKQRVTAFHLTGVQNIDNMINLQGKKKSISSFFYMHHSHYDRGVRGGGGVIFELDANLLGAFEQDIMSDPDKSGMRWITLEYLVRAAYEHGEPLVKLYSEMADLLKTLLKKYAPNVTYDSDIDAGNKWKEFGKSLAAAKDGKTQNLVIKDYIDGTYAIMLKHAEHVRKALFYYMDKPGSTQDDWDEVVVNEFKIKTAHVLKSTTEDPQNLEKLKQLESKGIPVRVWDSPQELNDYVEKIGMSQKLEENFADGKVKGKSRPGRVKRAGASCNGSVTQLRKRAKNASGEKAKMYHWCANMKSGRKKK